LFAGEILEQRCFLQNIKCQGFKINLSKTHFQLLENYLHSKLRNRKLLGKKMTANFRMAWQSDFILINWCQLGLFYAAPVFPFIISL
jgi:hypothetical protein